MRICTLCKKKKSLESFGASKKGKFGKESQCKNCRKIKAAKYRKKNKELCNYRSYLSVSKKPEYYKKIKKEWAKKNSKRVAELAKNWAFNNKEKRRKAASDYRSKYPLKIEARKIARLAILKGKLIRLPCRFCGKLKVEAHHPDYNKPLEVKWLCKKHHIKEHYE